MAPAPDRRREVVAARSSARRVEDRHVRHITVGLFGKKHFLIFVGEQQAAIKKGVQPLIVGLVIVGDQRMVVTLPALQVHAEKICPTSGRQQVGFAFAIEIKAGLGAGRGIDAIGCENLADQLIVRFVGRERFVQILLPLGDRDILFRLAAPSMPRRIRLTCAGRTRGWPAGLNQCGTFVGRSIGGKGPGFNNRWDSPDQVQGRAAEFGVTGRRGERDQRIGLDQPINLLVQWLVRTQAHAHATDRAADSHERVRPAGGLSAARQSRHDPGSGACELLRHRASGRRASILGG